jgi:hypothetical protein
MKEYNNLDIKTCEYCKNSICYTCSHYNNVDMDDERFCEWLDVETYDDLINFEQSYPYSELPFCKICGLK